MDINVILVMMSLLMLIAYLLDLLGKRIRIPSVILMIFLGIALRQLSTMYGFEVHYVKRALPIFGTIGLILIVLEGSLDLDLSIEKMPLIKKVLSASLLIVAATCGLVVFVLMYFFGVGGQAAIVNALPLSIISSAIAIPAAQSLPRMFREFVTYESTLTDIIGILLFNAAIAEQGFSGLVVMNFFLSLLIMTVISVLLSLLMVYFLDKIRYRIKFLPILAFLILVYASAKFYHQSPLILILLFGLMLNNTDLFVKGIFEKNLNNQHLKNDLIGLKQFTAEIVFLVRTFFFVSLGYTIDLQEVMTVNNFVFALLLLNIIVNIRWLGLLIIDRTLVNPLLFFTPRGLITVLLYLSIPEQYKIPQINDGVLIMVVLLSLVFMMRGSWFVKKVQEDLIH